MSAAGLFITGTDTGVGKTLVTCALAQGLRRQGYRVGVMKPVETGYRGTGWPADAEQLRLASGTLATRAQVVPYIFEDPVSPWAGTRRTGVAIDWPHLLDTAKALRDAHDVLLVEGAGGLAVPITPDRTMVHLARDLELPLVIVARSSLGTINHTVLSVEYAKSQGVSVAGIVMNLWDPASDDPSQNDNPDLIHAMSKVPLWGVLPRLDRPDPLHVVDALHWPLVHNALGYRQEPDKEANL